MQGNSDSLTLRRKDDLCMSLQYTAQKQAASCMHAQCAYEYYISANTIKYSMSSY
jgi:hypothetical protein